MKIAAMILAGLLVYAGVCGVFFWARSRAIRPWWEEYAAAPRDDLDEV